LLSRSQQNVTEIIEKHYYSKTNRPLSKIDFGELLMIAAKEKGEVGQSELEKLLLKIQEKMHKRIDIGY